LFLVSKEKMKALFKRSSSKNLLEAAASTRRESMETEDPQEEKLGAVLRQFSFEGRAVIKEGWGEKESGQKIFGHYNWRKRWFRLTQKSHIVLFSYYVKPTETNPKGEVMLTQEYTARELELGEKSKPHCFALGPLTDSSALRTYYVSCGSDDEKLDWIATLNCIIEGVPEKVLKRKTTYRARSRHLNKGKRMTYPPPALDSKGDTYSYQKLKWRMDQWNALCSEINNSKWKKADVKNDVKISRQSFKDTDVASFKIESMVEAPRQIVYEFLQRSLKSGGKFDFIFRGENLLQRIEEYETITEIIWKDFDVPLPGMKRRDATLARMWVPDFLTQDATSGLLVMSVHHPQANSSKDLDHVFVDISGLILCDEEDANGEMCTRIFLIMQIDLQNALQNMLRGAFKSGLIKKGIRNGFSHFSKCLSSYYQMMVI